MYIESRSVLFVYTHKETLSCTGFWLDFPRVLQQNRDEVPRLVITAKSKRTLKKNIVKFTYLKKVTKTIYTDTIPEKKNKKPIIFHISKRNQNTKHFMKCLV